MFVCGVHVVTQHADMISVEKNLMCRAMCGRHYYGVIMYSCSCNAGMSSRIRPVLFVWRPVELFEATYEKGPKITVCK